MLKDVGNLFQDIPQHLPDELCQSLFFKAGLTIERIVSKGHASPKDFWYDQSQDEWVLLLSGEAKLEYEDGSIQLLTAGDYVLISAYCRHRVLWTAPDTETIWLAIFLPN